jgi:2-polyprenyl-6-methoxyphenol hydroxylase-like FAD-dependent oxidoreductase
MKPETDVMIVGAGPVGLFLAHECARRGLSYRIVEAHVTQSPYSKALSVFPRTLEILDMAGIVDPFLAAANRVTSVAVTAHGRTLARLPFSPEDSPYPFVAMIPQSVTERLLVEALKRRGSGVEYETTFVSATPREDRVTITLEHGGERTTFDAAFLVGCDGAHSAVRHMLNLELEGAEYAPDFLLADIQTNDLLPAHELQLCPSELGPVAIFPMSATHRRVVATVAARQGDAPSLELVQQILRERGPRELEARDLMWSSYFRIHHRHAPKLRVGRCFLAGDAAHVHSPFGGQGMNTGLQDVWNLVWKLDLALRGRANERLLDSYEAERLPVIEQVIRTADMLTKVLGTPSRLAQTLRNAIIPIVSRLPAFQHAFVRRLSELGISYRRSPIVVGPGKRYFDESIRGGHLGTQFVLLVNDADPEARRAAMDVTDAFGELVELQLSPQRGITLVRPDGYVAYSTLRNNAEALASARTLLERQAA